MKKKDSRYSVIGGKHRALSRYYIILNRLKNTNTPRNSCYKGVKMTMTKDEFVNWFMANDFDGASVDRIDKTKDYSIDNVQLIPLVENMRKDRIKEKNGICQCFRCKAFKGLEDFAKDKRRVNGRSTICKICDNARRKKKLEWSTGR